MFWVHGDAQAAVLRDILRRLGGEAAAATLDIAADAVRGVAYGVVGTAAIQAVVLAIGLGIAGVPVPPCLASSPFCLRSASRGATDRNGWGGAAIWQFGQQEQGWGIFIIFGDFA